MANGETVVFECLPQAWPEPSIQWRRNGQLLDLEDSRLIDGSVKYSINRLARTDFATDNSSNNSPLEEISDGRKAQLNDGPMDLFGSRLVIRQVDKNDEGNYSCLVETKGSQRHIERESPGAILQTFGKFERS